MIGLSLVCVAVTSADGKTFLTKRVAASRSWCPPSLQRATRVVVRARLGQTVSAPNTGHVRQELRLWLDDAG